MPAPISTHANVFSLDLDESGPAAPAAPIANGLSRSTLEPIVELATRRTVGYEAIGRVELLTARLALRAIDRLPAEAFLALNVSPPTVASPRLAEMLEGIQGSRVVFELTERTGVEDYAALERALEPYRATGIRVAIDDVGAGFASLKHVLRLSPEILKLDASITARIHVDRVRRALVASFVSFAEQVGTTLAVEGIATEAALGVLVGLGVGLGQGRVLGRPTPLSSTLAPAL
jgi:EAL domain-containing protein (putative c-di-GMP-specific phosphodiesterase class I)